MSILKIRNENGEFVPFPEFQANPFVHNEKTDSEIDAYSCNYINSRIEVADIKIPSTDLNDYKTTGYYFFNATNTPVNKPDIDISRGFLEVIARNENDIKQIWYVFHPNSLSNNKRFERVCGSGSWGEWSGFVDNYKENLYKSTSGSSSTIELSRAVEDFTEVEVFGRANDVWCSVKIPIGLTSKNNGSMFTTGATNLYHCNVSLSGTSLTFDYNRTIPVGGGNATNTSAFKIYKVVGYK